MVCFPDNIFITGFFLSLLAFIIAFLSLELVLRLYNIKS